MQMYDVSHHEENKKKQVIKSVKAIVFLIVHPESTTFDILCIYNFYNKTPKLEEL